MRVDTLSTSEYVAAPAVMFPGRGIALSTRRTCSTARRAVEHPEYETDLLLLCSCGRRTLRLLPPTVVGRLVPTPSAAPRAEADGPRPVP